MLRLLITSLLSLMIVSAGAESAWLKALPKKSSKPEGFNQAALMDRLGQLDLHTIEGVWQLTETDATIAIVRSASPSRGALTHYEMILLHSPHRSLRPGTVMGRVSPTAKSEEYEAKFYTKAIGSTLTIPKRYIMTIDPANNQAITFRETKGSWRINPLSLLPYLWRLTVKRGDATQPSHGCIRVYPAPSLPLNPIYL